MSTAREGWPRRGRTLAASLETGERVFVRNPVAGDRDEWVALRRRSRAFLRPWDPRPPRGFDPYGPEAFDRMLRGLRDPRRESLLVCRIEDRAIVGQVNASEIVHGALQSAYLGYWIGRDFARQGLQMRPTLKTAAQQGEHLGSFAGLVSGNQCGGGGGSLPGYPLGVHDRNHLPGLVLVQNIQSLDIGQIARQIGRITTLPFAAGVTERRATAGHSAVKSITGKVKEDFRRHLSFTCRFQAKHRLQDVNDGPRVQVERIQ